MAIRVTKDNFSDLVLNSKLPVLVDFYSDSCVACKKLAPVLGNLEDEYEGKLEVVKVNTNFDAELAAEYNIRSNPIVVLFKEGKKIGQKVGAVSYKDLEEWVLGYLN